MSDLRTGLSVADLKQSFLDTLFCTLGRVPSAATPQDLYTALALTVRDRVLKLGVRTLETCHDRDARVVAYLSAEYLPGPHLAKNLLNLGIGEQTRQAVEELGYNLDFCNVTNGVTPRRFLGVANPPMTQLITRHIGEGWLRNLDQLRKLEPLADNPAFREQWRAVKLAAARMGRFSSDRAIREYGEQIWQVQPVPMAKAPPKPDGVERGHSASPGSGANQPSEIAAGA